MRQVKWISASFGGVLLLAGVVGILESGAADVFLEATRPDFQKISLAVAGMQNAGGPDWLGGRIEEVLKKDVKRSLVFDLVDLLGLGIQTSGIGNGKGAGSERVFKEAAEKGVSVLVWGKAGLKETGKGSDVKMESFG